jgi:esterase/lipase superfamily enzyme
MRSRVSLRASLAAIVTVCLLDACATQKQSVTTAGSTTKPQVEELERAVLTGSTARAEAKEATEAPPESLPPNARMLPAATPSVDLKKLQRVSYVKLFYATDRRWTGSTSQPKWFGSEWNEREQDHLTYGTCDVSIPVRVHKPGEVEKPSILRLELSEDADKHVIVYTPQRLARAAFFTALENEVRAKQQREIMVFIHGFNNTFDDAASRLGVLDYDLQFGGTPVLYSWTSVGGGFKGVVSYRNDEKTIQKTYQPLADFLFEVAQSGRLAGAKRVNIIAHSMGNRALVAAMKDLALRKPKKLLFDEVVMAAPDVGLEGFATVEWPKMQTSARGSAKRVTLYASSDDRALQTSKLAHHYARRIGEAGTGLLVLPGLDTVDATGADFTYFGLNHTYFGGPRVLRDLGALVQKGFTPAQRRLQEMKRAPLSYWLLPRLTSP